MRGETGWSQRRWGEKSTASTARKKTQGERQYENRQNNQVSSVCSSCQYNPPKRNGNFRRLQAKAMRPIAWPQQPQQLDPGNTCISCHTSFQIEGNAVYCNQMQIKKIKIKSKRRSLGRRPPRSLHRQNSKYGSSITIWPVPINLPTLFGQLSTSHCPI